jgi:hypothetical protein
VIALRRIRAVEPHHHHPQAASRRRGQRRLQLHDDPSTFRSGRERPRLGPAHPRHVDDALVERQRAALGLIVYGLADVVKERVASPSDWGPSVNKYRCVYSDDRVHFVEPSTREVVHILD